MAGGTASGKTTLARKLVERTGALLITHDRYYRDIPHPRGFNFDHPDSLETALLEDHLDSLCRGEAVDLPIYDFATHSRREETERVEPPSLLLIEGILVLHSERLVHAANLVVFVDAPDDLRLLRRLRRDIAERGRSVESVLDQYLETVRPMHLAYVEPGRSHAQLIVDGTAESDRVVDQVVREMQGLGWVMGDALQSI